jgi:cold shock CspA family protein
MRAEITNVNGLRKGFCFAVVTDESSPHNNETVLLHAKDRAGLQEAFDQLQPGDIVEFGVTVGDKGLRGTNIQIFGHGERFTGRISRLLRNAGFIQLDDGRDAFFRYRSCRWFITNSDLDTRVECSLIEETNGLVAVGITRI